MQRKVAMTVAAALAWLGLLAHGPVQAQGTYPNKPIRWVVPYTAGGFTDVSTRLTLEKINLGQAFVVDNKPGANSLIGAEAVAKSPPDGYTFLTVIAAHAANKTLYAGKLGFDPETSFAPVSVVGIAPLILTVTNGLPVKTVGELIAYAKANPGKISFGSSGIGAAAHLTSELMKQVAGIQMEHVPYKGTAPALADLVSGNIQMLTGGTTTMLPYIKNGQIRPLAITKRVSVASNIPTYGEQGYPTLDFNLWHGMIAPRGVPGDVVKRMNSELDAALKSPDAAGRLAQDGVVAVGGSSEAFMATLRGEVKRWTDFIQRTGIKLE